MIEYLHRHIGSVGDLSITHTCIRLGLLSVLLMPERLPSYIVFRPYLDTLDVTVDNIYGMCH